jgi:hypothetical protein
MTYGGFDTTRSKRSPASGSSRLPRRRSRVRPSNGPPRAAAFSPALKSAMARQREETSVATTSALWVARWNAWTPQPVPTSAARRTGRRGVQRARVVEAPPTPSTWSARRGRTSAAGRVRSDASHHSSSSAPYGASSSSGRTSSSGPAPLTVTSPSRTAPAAPSAGSAASRSPRGTGRPSSRSRTSVASGPGCARVARSAGRSSSRPSAAWAIGPSRRATGPSRYPWPSTAARSDASRSSRLGSDLGTGTPSGVRCCSLRPVGGRRHGDRLRVVRQVRRAVVLTEGDGP